MIAALRGQTDIFLTDIENLYHAIIESNEDAIVSKDLDGVVQSWNPGAQRLFGYDEAEMIGQSIRRLLPPDRQNEEDLILDRIRHGEKVGLLHTRRLHKQGHLVDVSLTVSPIRNAAGKVVGASKIARDVSDYVESQRLLRETEDRFRLLADNIAPLAWIAGPDGGIGWYNKRWYDFTGTTPEEVLGNGWKLFHHPDHLQRATELYMQAIDAGEEWEDTFPLRRHDGEYRWFLSRAKPIRNDDGSVECWFGTNSDITEQRQSEEQIRLLLMEVNHRSKNLLGLVQALARRTVRDGGEDFIERLESRIRSLAVNQDILVKREWREVPVRELAEMQLDFLKGSPGEFTLEGPEVKLAPRAAEVIGMALHELATNALKYGALSVAGGAVHIGWDMDRTEDNFSIWWRESGGPPVQDNGHRGFGSTLIREVPQHNLSATVVLAYNPHGVCWELTCSGADACRPIAGRA